MYNAVIFTAYAVNITAISIHDNCNPIESRTPALSETGVRIDLVAGTHFEADLMHAPIITSRWIYVPAKQGARKIERVGHVVAGI